MGFSSRNVVRHHFSSSVLCASHVRQYHNDGKAARSKFEGAKRVPATVSAIADAVRWAEGPLRPQSALRARFHQLTQGLRKSRGLLLTDTFASSEESVDPLVSNHR